MMIFHFFKSNNVHIENIVVTKKASPPIQIEQTGIHQLIIHSKTDDVRNMLLSLDKQELNSVEKGMTPIMLAASKGNVEIIDLLFVHGADPNKRGGAKRTALQYATEKPCGCGKKISQLRC